MPNSCVPVVFSVTSCVLIKCWFNFLLWWCCFHSCAFCPGAGVSWWRRSVSWCTPCADPSSAPTLTSAWLCSPTDGNHHSLGAMFSQHCQTLLQRCRSVAVHSAARNLFLSRQMNFKMQLGGGWSENKTGLCTLLRCCYCMCTLWSENKTGLCTLLHYYCCILYRVTLLLLH